MEKFTERNNEKECTKCKNIKPNSEFYNDSTKKFNLASNCKACCLLSKSKIGQREYYRANNSLKKCSQCGIEKNTTEFTPSKKTKDGFRCWCKECICKYNHDHKYRCKNYYHLDLDKSRRLAREKSATRRLKRFNLTNEELNKICEGQDNKCKICQKEAKLVIDHDHQTGIFRGLLCRKCNSGIGLLQDNPEILRQAVLYLEGGNNE